MKDIKIDPKADLVFNPKVREQCKSCKRYGAKATCPPYMDSLEYYQVLLPTYKYGVILYNDYEVVGNWIESGNISSLDMYTHILDLRNRLLEKYHFIIAFGAGSCRLCPTCVVPCKKPNLSLTPMEGTGIDVVETMKRLGVEIKFPVKDKYYRVGVILYG